MVPKDAKWHDGACVMGVTHAQMSNVCGGMYEDEMAQECARDGRNAHTGGQQCAGMCARK